MIETGHKTLSIYTQARLLGVSRDRLVKKALLPRVLRTRHQDVLEALDKLPTRWPFYGQRKLQRELRDQCFRVYRKYPYPLRELEIHRPDQVWCADITCISMELGHAYLMAVMD